MKRIIALMCACMTLVLVGCSGKPDDTETTTTTTASTTTNAKEENV